MPINTLQKRGRQIGEIRLGIQVEGKRKDGSTYMRPDKLDTFRFTTKSPSVAQAVAQLLGGEARPIKLLNGEASHEVVTGVTELPVMVPPGDNVISQWYELYTKGGCQRRCDGEIEQLTQTPCKCPFDQEQRNEMAKNGGACKPTTRLNVMLPDLPDLGVWLLTSHGFNAAVELGGTAEVLSAAREKGVIIPAKLRLEQRQTVKNGETNKYAVPVLELMPTLREMTAIGAGGGIASALPPAPNQGPAALGAGTPPSMDMRQWIHSVLDDDQRAELSPVWKRTFDFLSDAVPLDKEQAARTLVESFRHRDDEPIEAELVHDDDPERPFD